MGVLVLISILILLCWIWKMLGHSWRISFVFALLSFNVILVTITEILSVFQLITFQYVLTIWFVVGFICLMILHQNRALFKLHIEVRRWHLSKMQYDWRHGWPALLAVLVAILICINGIIYEPNSIDSMSYHLPRIAHWIQNHSVFHFPTHTIRQLTMSPGAEFTMMHLILLSKTDHLAFLSQWFSMIGSVIVTTLIAEQLGANKAGQVLAGVVSISIPVGILEASGTLNDYVVSLWALCFTLFSLQLLSGDYSLSAKFGLSASLGLAILTKSTAIIYVIPIVIWILWRFIIAPRREILLSMLWAGIVALSMNSGHFVRNYSVYGSPLGLPADTNTYLNQIHTPKAVLSNIVRNVSLHFSTPSQRTNLLVEGFVKKIHSYIRFGVNDPRTTFAADHPAFKYQLSTSIRHELYAGNLFHFTLIFMTTLIFFVRKKNFDGDSANFLLTIYLCTTLGMFLLFNIVLKWQPLHTRQQLPFFLHFSPFIAIVVARSFKPLITNFVIGALILFSLPWILFNQSRPLVPAQSIKVLLSQITLGAKVIANDQPEISGQAPYSFLSDPETQLYQEIKRYQPPYSSALNYLESLSCKEVGFIPGIDNIEYPIWKRLNPGFSTDFRIEHVLVSNGSQVMEFAYPPFDPCAIISMSEETAPLLHLNGNIFNQEFFSANEKGVHCCSVKIYVRADD